MAEGANWVDLLDPDEAAIREHTPRDLHPNVLAELLRPGEPDGNIRPTLQGYGSYVFGALLVAVAVPDEDRVLYQEVDVVLTRSAVLTVRKTPPGEEAYDPEPVRKVCEVRGELPAGMIAYHLLDDIAERYLDLLDDIDSEIDELEESMERWSNEHTRKRLSEIRHDLVHLRRTLAPTRDAVRGVVDGRVDIEGRALFTREVFPPDVERQFGTVHDKLLRAAEALELARDLLAAARDYHQAKIANEQNEVMKTLTVIVSLLVLPTFIVGVYGQNFDHMPELHWQLGYAFSWAVIVVSTFAQLVFFRWRKWI